MRIIVLTDFSTHAEGAMEVAAKIAKLQRVEVEIVHVEEEKSQIAHLDRVLQSHATTWQRKGIEVTSTLLDCSIEEIPYTLKLQKDDLLIMGTHGQRGWKEKWVGTYTQRMLRVCHNPILAVPLMEDHWTLEEILYVSDFRKPSIDHQILSGIQFYFSAFSPEIHFLRILTPDERNEEDDFANMKIDGFSPSSMQVPRMERFDAIEDLIFSHAHEIDTDIIALKTHSHSSLYHFLFGSIAESLMTRSNKPVLVQRIPHES